MSNFVFTLDDLLVRQVRQQPEQMALVHGEQSLSYRALTDRVQRAAATLTQQGIVRGDRVGIHLPKGFSEVVATFACARVGAVFVNVNYLWTTGQLRHVAEDCGMRLLITDASKLKMIREIDALSKQLEAVISDVALQESGSSSEMRIDRPPIGADLAALLYTSGSTGRPKGVMLSHANLLDGARSVAQYLRNEASDQVLSLLPLSFDYGLSQITTACLVGASVVLQAVSMPAELVRTVRDHQITGFASVPTVWTQLVRYLVDKGETLAGLRYVTNSGGKIPSAILEQMPACFPECNIVLMYGLTEAFRSSYLPPEQFQEKMGSMGRAIPNVELFVVDAQRGLCGVEEEGELIHRGALISRGYWGNPSATRARIKPNAHLESLIGEEPVLHSGDIVKRDADGFLWFVGRKDALIKSSGFRISPEEVEALLYESGLVQDAVAFGVFDDVFGEVVHVATRFAAGAQGSGLLKYCRNAMPSYMVPRRIIPWDSPFPQTSSGKIDRVAVRQMSAADVETT